MQILTRRIPWDAWTCNETYAGFDIALTTSGIAVLEKGVLWLYTLHTKELRGGSRLSCIFRVVDHILYRHDVQAAAIENGAYEAGGRIFELGGANAVVQLSLTQHDIPYILVSPTSLKKYWTGNFEAKKRRMVKRANQVVENKVFSYKDHDTADAFALAMLAHGHAQPETIRTRHAMEVVRKIVYEDHVWQTDFDIESD